MLGLKMHELVKEIFHNTVYQTKHTVGTHSSTK